MPESIDQRTVTALRTDCDPPSQAPVEGVSFASTLNNAQEPDRHTTQYFEMFGNRGVYHRGWTAVTKHHTPWRTGAEATPSFDEDVWELYDTNTDWSQSKNLASTHPEKLAELQDLFLQEARRHQVLPLDDRLSERINADLAGRTGLALGNTPTLGPTAGWLREDVVPNLKNSSFRIIAAFASSGDDEGVLVAQGGRHAGWSLYVEEGRPVFAYNYVGLALTTLRAPDALSSDDHVVEVVFAYDGGGLGQGGEARLVVDGAEVDRARIERTVPFFFSIDSTLDVGLDRGSPVTSYTRGEGNPYTGTIATVTLVSGDDAERGLTTQTGEDFRSQAPEILPVCASDVRRLRRRDDCAATRAVRSAADVEVLPAAADLHQLVSFLGRQVQRRDPCVPFGGHLPALSSQWVRTSMRRAERHFMTEAECPIWPGRRSMAARTFGVVRTGGAGRPTRPRTPTAQAVTQPRRGPLRRRGHRGA